MHVHDAGLHESLPGRRVKHSSYIDTQCKVEGLHGWLNSVDCTLDRTLDPTLGAPIRTSQIKRIYLEVLMHRVIDI